MNNKLTILALVLGLLFCISGQASACCCSADQCTMGCGANEAESGNGQCIEPSTSTVNTPGVTPLNAIASCDPGCTCMSDGIPANQPANLIKGISISGNKQTTLALSASLIRQVLYTPARSSSSVGPPVTPLLTFARYSPPLRI